MAWLSGSLSYPDGGQAGRKLQKDDETLVYDHPGGCVASEGRGQTP